MRILTFLLLLALAGSAPARANLVDQAAADLKVQRVDEALAFLNQAIAANPSDPRAYAYRAYALSCMGNWDQAVADCHQALDLNPRFAQAYCIMGNANWMKGRLEDAGDDFNEAISLAPGDPDNWFSRGVFYAKKDRERSIADLSQALRLSPTFEKALYQRGTTYMDGGQFDL
ncbi:MAG TPA: tetratricopeptide repeat protein, partial [Chthoniobacteraceae bacterium]|nr:tetratricopeptide repeat protein [Chthoniobacteraceae bacterium]